MTPRRKTDQPEGEAEAPKKKRAPRRKKAEAEAVPPVSASPETPPAAAAPTGLDAIPKAPPLGQHLPVNAPPVVSPKIVIEPDTRYTPHVAGEPQKVEDRWTPAKKDDKDLTMPPKVLLQSKRVPQEVEDILDLPEPDGDEDEAPHEARLLRPPVRSGLYRKIGIGFAVLVVLSGIGVAYFTYAQATVVVYPKKAVITAQNPFGIDVVEKPSAPFEVAGEVQEVMVSGEESIEPGASSEDEADEPKEAAAPAADANAVYTGTVTLYNKTAAPVTLVATTRLLTPGDVLFRIKNRTTIPAGGTATASVYADKPGSSGAIGPSDFTIPGLPADRQTVIYAKSAAAMTADGAAAAAAVPEAASAAAKVTVRPEEIKKLQETLQTELAAQAKEELAKKTAGAWSGEAYSVDIMSCAVAPFGTCVFADPIEVSGKLTVRLTLRVRYVGFDRTKAIGLAVDDLKRGLNSELELSGVNGDDADITVTRADAKAKTAHLTIDMKGEASVSLESPLFDADKLRGLDLNAVKTYFEGIEGVERVDVRFRPFWLKRMPTLKDHIKFQIQK